VNTPELTLYISIFNALDLLFGMRLLFHQYSFYWKSIDLSSQLLFQQHYLHFSPEEKSGGNVRGKCPRPVLILCLREVVIML